MKWKKLEFQFLYVCVKDTKSGLLIFGKMVPDFVLSIREL